MAADGSTTYNDTPCAADETVVVLSKSARKVSVLGCRITYTFAFDAVARMRQDDNTEDVFNAYGGAANLSNEAREIINNVFSFENNKLVSSQYIVNVIMERCQAGLLGKTLDQCNAFPKDFIARIGGCSKARESDQNILIQPPRTDGLSINSTGGRTSNAQPTLNAAKPVGDAPDRNEKWPIKPTLRSPSNFDPETYQD